MAARWNLELEQLFTEIACEDWDEWEGDNEEVTTTTPASTTTTTPAQTLLQTEVIPPDLTESIIENVLVEISTDPCYRRDICQAASDLNNTSRQEVRSTFVWMTECVIIEKGKINREKSYEHFHNTYIKNINTITSTTGCVKLGALIGQKSFAALIKTQNIPEQDTLPVKLSDSDTEILQYVGGCVVKKLIQRTYKLNDSSDKTHILTCLKTDTGTADTNEKSMFNLYNRGGLTSIGKVYTPFFYQLENNFRSSKSETKFIDISLKSSQTKILFDNYVAEDNIKNKIIHDLIKLFYKIRIYHRCKVAIDAYRQHTHTTKKQKALRSKLKQSE